MMICPIAGNGSYDADVFGRLTAIGVAVAVGLSTTACGGTSHSATPKSTRITVSVGQCGAGWKVATAGQQHFVLDNTDTRSGEVLLTDARTAAVYADVEPVGAGTRADLDIALGSGSYAFRCAMEDEATVVGPTVTIPGKVPGPTKPVAAVTQGDLVGATKNYQGYVKGRIPTLVRLTTALRSAIAARDLAAARRAWLPAHLEYERLGAAYDAFGDLDGTINGLPDSLPGGVHDPGWQGFHRLEYGLWHGQSAAALLPAASALLIAVKQLGTEFATAQIDPLVLSIRAHEITENALQFELTGQTDFGSRSNLATVAANLDGTRTVLGIIRPLLAPRDPQLSTLDAELNRTAADLAAVHRSSAWPALGRLSRPERERLNSDLSELTELLAPVASILEPRRAS
jgi:iron uptake system component EfeO